MTANDRRLSVLLGPRSQAGQAPLPRTDADWHGFLELANRTWLIGAIAWRLEAHGLIAAVPPVFRDYLDGATELGRLRAADQLRQTWDVARLLNAQGIVPVALKGTAAQLTALYPEPGARLSGDIDLLVAPTQLAAAVAALQAAGYAPRNAELPYFRPTRSKHFPRLFHPAATFGIELHQHIEETIFETVLPTEDILAAAERIDQDGATLSVPAPEHRLLHCLIHVLGDFRTGQPIVIRQLFELRLMAAAYRADWPVLAARFDRQGLRRPLEHCLLLAEFLVGLPYPAALHLGLRGRVQRLILPGLHRSGLAAWRVPGVLRFARHMLVDQDFGQRLRLLRKKPGSAVKYLNSIRKSYRRSGRSA